MFDFKISNKKQEYLLAILSGLILALPWYKHFSGVLLFIGFIPLLWVENHIASTYKKPKGRVFLLALVTALTWNITATWWIYNASFAGLLSAVIVSSLFMTIAFFLFHLAKKKLGNTIGYVSFVIFWIAFEFSYLHGQISWPWLTLGYGFLYNIKLIQWYEFTGALGGTLWVLIMNLLLFFFLNKSIRSTFTQQKKKILSIAIPSILFLPILISVIQYYSYKEKENPYDIIVVQPNMDPYLKFNHISPIEHAMTQIEEADKLADEHVDFIVTPETSLLGDFWIGHFNEVRDIRLIRQLLKKYPQCSYVAGIVCRKRYKPGEAFPETARPMGRHGDHYDYYNSAILVDTTSNIQLYHKSQLVTGIEKMPYKRQLRFLEKAMVNLGGTFRSNAIQEERDVFQPLNDSVKVGPVICWESVFGEYVTDYVKKGANLLFIITNDGWWGNTPGHKHHNALGSIRAIETRRSVARSANTGISSFINQRGDILQELTWWKQGALRERINANNKITFYVKYGDYIGRTAFWLGIFTILLIFVAFLKPNKV